MAADLDVIGLGENSVDRVLVVPALPAASEKLQVQSANRLCGGQVATTLAACAHLGLRTAYAGTIGNDDDGRLVRDTLAARGIDLTHLRVRPIAATRWATILVDARTGDRAVLWDRDAALSLTESEVAAIDVARARLVHVDDTDIAASLQLARTARTSGVLVTTDVDAGCGADNALALIELATHAVLSEHALAALAGTTEPERGLRALRARSRAVLVVTLGPRGAMALADSDLVTAPGIAVDAVDTTGAGDVFRAGLITALLEGRALPETLRFANAAAALSCTRLGAIGGVPMRREVDALLR